MLETQGHVTVNERVPSERFNRYVNEKVRDWLRQNNIDEDNSAFEVAFFDEDSLGEISCLVVLQCGSQMWRAWESADNSRIALARSLEHLHAEITGATDITTGTGTDIGSGIQQTH